MVAVYWGMLAKLLSAVVPLHHAAEHGYLNRLPKELLTPESISKKRWINGRNWSVLELAASRGHLDQVPKHLLNVEMFGGGRSHGRCGHTAETEPLIFVVASRGQLDCVPEEIFEYEMVKESGKDESGRVFSSVRNS